MSYTLPTDADERPVVIIGRLVADRLVVAGDTVCHISSDGRASAHQLASFATVGADGEVTYPVAP